MKDLKTLLEASLMDNAISEASLLDIDGTIEDGNKYNDVDLEMLMNTTSESEFNIIYDILKDKIESTQKKPKFSISDDGKKHVDAKPGEYYIVFYTYERRGKEIKTVFFGNEETGSLSWSDVSERRHKPETSWSTFRFAFSDSSLCDFEMRVLSNEWSKQIEKILKKLGR